MINRRTFLKSAGLVAVGAILPPVLRPWWSKEYLRELAASAKAASIVEQQYVVYLHPASWRMLREYEAWWHWKHAWRCYRVARREGVCGYLPPSEVWARFAPTRHPIPHEIGRYENIRFIESNPSSMRAEYDFLGGDRGRYAHAKITNGHQTGTEKT